ncbi:MAG: SDR family oxidoreductase [Gemmatimonadales bacterium]|jgi:3-oxoacyl-[acyl-carrier protein] reductase
MDLELDGRVALVGGSSSGLGLAIAATLAEEGCEVALNGRDPDRLQLAVQTVLPQARGRIDGFRADISIPGDVTKLVEGVSQRLGPVDILVCNAGGPPATAFETAPEDSWRSAIELNLLSTINLCRAVVPGMRQRGWGRVICLTSVGAKQPLGDLILSTTARAGVLGFAKALADEAAPDGVTVNAVCPGYMKTERVGELLGKRAEMQRRPPDEILAGLVQGIPMRRMGEPEELAATVAFLASERASYITGVALQIDGGFVRSIL